MSRTPRKRLSREGGAQVIAKGNVNREVAISPKCRSARKPTLGIFAVDGGAALVPTKDGVVSGDGGLDGLGW
jgi:hypothetical protein